MTSHKRENRQKKSLGIFQAFITFVNLCLLTGEFNPFLLIVNTKIFISASVIIYLISVLIFKTFFTFPHFKNIWYPYIQSKRIK